VLCLLSGAQLLLSGTIDLLGSKSRTLLFVKVFETEASRSCRLNPSSRWVGTGLCSSSPLPRFHFETTCARVEDVGHTILPAGPEGPWSYKEHYPALQIRNATLTPAIVSVELMTRSLLLTHPREWTLHKAGSGSPRSQSMPSCRRVPGLYVLSSYHHDVKLQHYGNLVCPRCLVASGRAQFQLIGCWLRRKMPDQAG
jgi:hypothetical protein